MVDNGQAVGVALRPKCYTRSVPTTRPRHMVTETAELARDLDAATRRWPAEAGDRAKLLRRLLEEGYRAVLLEQERTAVARREAVERTAGALTGTYDDGYLE